MARSRISKFDFGRSGMKRLLRRNRRLRTTISKKGREHILKAAKKYQSGGGIRGGKDSPFHQDEIDKLRGDLRKLGDPISRRQAKVLEQELRQYQSRIATDKRLKRASREALQQGRFAYNDDAQAAESTQSSADHVPNQPRGPKGAPRPSIPESQLDAETMFKYLRDKETGVAPSVDRDFDASGDDYDYSVPDLPPAGE